MNISSRFNRTPQIYVNGRLTYGRWVQPSFLDKNLISSKDVQKVRIDQRYKGRPDLLANDLYGIAELSWVLIMFNKPFNTLGWPYAGTTIEAPTRTIVMRNL